MSSTADFQDILGIDRTQDKSTVFGFDNFQNEKKAKKVSKLSLTAQFKKPDGMHRELYNLLRSDLASLETVPLMQQNKSAYKSNKVKMSKFKPRAWKWTPFTNPARTDGALFYHWRRVRDEQKEYPFARFNKKIALAVYSDMEYQQHLTKPGWTKEETDHLMDLCKQFDLRFIVIHDRYDRVKYKPRSVEDLKERYYDIYSILQKLRSGTSPAETKPITYDSDHERQRKAQLEKLWNRTPEEVKEEEKLIEELRKIESRKREREKKAQDLQKLITAVDSNVSQKKSVFKTTKKKGHLSSKKSVIDFNASAVDSASSVGIRWPDFRAPGVTVRSHRMKLPGNVGQKKMKAIDQLLNELGVDSWPMPTQEIVTNFNELRSDIVILYDLKQAHAAIDYELQSLNHTHKSLSALGLSSGSSLKESANRQSPIAFA